MLLQDLYRMLQFLAELYGDVLPVPSRQQSTGNLVPEAHDSSTSRVQALLNEAATRRVVEVYAEDNAELYFEELGWKVKRVGSEKRGYDLECINDQGETLHVEVKGSQSMGEEVFLTRNEACHNGLLPQCDASHALYVLSGIRITGATDIDRASGNVNCVRPWKVDSESLTPTVYAYKVPQPNRS